MAGFTLKVKSAGFPEELAQRCWRQSELMISLGFVLSDWKDAVAINLEKET